MTHAMTQNTTNVIDIIVSKPTRPMTKYHIFFQLERAHIIQSSGDTAAITLKCSEIDTDSASRPPRYRSLILPKDWHRNGRRSKCRSHRKSHGKISFLDLSKVISQRWREVDQQTKKYCRDLASRELSRYREEMDAFVERFGADAIQMAKEQKKQAKYFKKFREMEKKKHTENRAKKEELVQEKNVAATQALVSKVLLELLKQEKPTLQSGDMMSAQLLQSQANACALSQVAAAITPGHAQTKRMVTTTTIDEDDDTFSCNFPMPWRSAGHPVSMINCAASQAGPHQRPTFGVSQEKFVRKISGDKSDASFSSNIIQEPSQDMENCSALTFDDDDDSLLGQKDVTFTTPADANRHPLRITNESNGTDGSESRSSDDDGVVDVIRAESVSPIQDYNIEPEVNSLAQLFVDKYYNSHFMEDDVIVDGVSRTTKQLTCAVSTEQGTPDDVSSKKTTYNMMKSMHYCSPCSPTTASSVANNGVKTSKRSNYTLGADEGLCELSKSASKRAKHVPPSLLFTFECP